jgi:hypothetical protein
MKQTQFGRRLCVLGLALTFLAVAGGCSGSGKVEGSVKYKGQPVEGATVVLMGDDGNPVATGVTDSSGKFKLKTPQGKEAIPSGTYIATVTKKEGAGGAMIDLSEGPASKDALLKMKAGMAAKGIGAGKSALPDQYSTKNSPLKITVPSGQYDLDLGN